MSITINGNGDVLTLSSASTAEQVYTPAGTGAVATTVQSKLRESVSVKDFGAKGDGVTDDTAAIQLGINAASTAGTKLYFPSGTYILTLGTNITLEGGATVCALVAKTGMQIVGDGFNHSILKLKDNQSSNASPKYFNIIAANTVLSDILIDSLQFDINGANNKINANNGFNCAAFIVSGSVATVGVDARVTNMKFTRNLVKNTPGNSCIGLGQSNSVGTVLGQNVEIANNIFYNNGLDTNDHSSIYAWAESVNIHDNLFYHPTMSNGTNGPRVACELHGARNNFHDNEVYNYFGGVYIAGNITNLSYNQSITNNDFVVCGFGATAYIESATELGCAYVTVNGNRIWITDDNHSASKVGIGINPSKGRVNNVSVNNNIIYSSDTNICVGISAYSLATTAISNIQIADNNIQGVTQGLKLSVAGGQLVDNLDVHGNLIKVTTTIGTPTFAFGVYLPGPIGTASIEGNKFSGIANSFVYADSTLTATTLRLNNNSGSDTFTYGINLTSNFNISNFAMDGNDFSLATTGTISDAFSIYGIRSGAQARTRSALPVLGRWSIGDVLNKTTPVAGGNPGWVCTTAGASEKELWTTGHTYAIGDVVDNSIGGFYKAASAGVAGATVPTHASGTVSDGGVSWTRLYLGAVALAVFKAQSNLAA